MRKACLLLLMIIPLLGVLMGCQSAGSGAVQAQSEVRSEVADGLALTPSPTLPLPTLTISPTLTQTPTPQDSPTPQATAIPEEHYITNYVGYRQWFDLSCEARAAVDWAGYFGVTIYEFDFQHALPLSDNPDFGFVGSVNGPWGQIPPYAYGVHAAPVADLLQQYGLNAVAYKKYSIVQIKEQLAADKPVIAWVIGNVEGGVPYIYTDSAGNEVQVGAYEHVVTITGYGPDTIRYINNHSFYDVPEDVFDNSWAVLDRMVVVMAE
jgi:uncharacterized protein YvpB